MVSVRVQMNKILPVSEEISGPGGLFSLVKNIFPSWKRMDFSYICLRFANQTHLNSKTFNHGNKKESRQESSQEAC
jgi:hypothetical protein